MIRKALHSFKAINHRQTLCSFVNSEGQMLNRTLAVSVVEIEQWVNGVDIKIAMPSLSSQMHNLFYNGSFDNDVDKLFEMEDSSTSEFYKQFNKWLETELI